MDKSASTVAGATPRRSTSSLADLSARFCGEEAAQAEAPLKGWAPPIRLMSAPLVVGARVDRRSGFPDSREHLMESRAIALRLRDFGDLCVGVLFIEAVDRPAGAADLGRI